MKTPVIQTAVPDLATQHDIDPASTAAPLVNPPEDFGANIDSMLSQFLATAEQKLAAIDQEILALSKKESDLTQAVNYHDAYTLICDTLKQQRNQARTHIERLFSSAKYLGTYTKLVGVGGNSLGEYHQEEKRQHHINPTFFKPDEVGFALMTDEQIEAYASDLAKRLERPEHGEPVSVLAEKYNAVQLRTLALRQQKFEINKRLKTLFVPVETKNGTTQVPISQEPWDPKKPYTFNDGQFVQLPPPPGYQPVTITIDGVTQ